MKSKEIIQEGPLDFAKRVGAGIAGALDTTSSFKTGYQQAASDQQLTDYAKKTYPAWNQAIVALKQQGVQDPQLGPELQDWATDYFGFQAPAFQGPVSAQSSMEYLKKLWAMKMVPRKQKAAPATNATTTTGNVSAAGATTAANAAPTGGNVSAAGTTTGSNAAAAGTTVSSTATSSAMFTDPAKFKDEWNKFVTAKSAGGVPYQLISDPENLNVLKTIWKYGGGVRAENRKNSKTPLTEAMLMEDPIYRSFKSVGRMLAEQKMSEKEIMDLFGRVEQGLTAGGANRTLIGKGKDVVTDIAGAINKAYQGVADKISRSGPVSGFDGLVDKLTDKLADAAGGQSGAVMTAIKKYREFAKKHPVMQGAIYAGLIALTGLSGAGLGGAAILGGIKAFDKLLLGNKASSALWSGFVTGATAYGLGQLKGAMSGGDAAGTPDTGSAPDLDAETAARDAALGKAYGIDGNDTLDQMNQAIMKTAEPGTIPADYSQLGAGAGDAATEYTVQSGDTLSQIAQQNNVSVQDLMQANPNITNPDVLKAGQAINIPAETGNAVYQGGVGTNADTMAKIASGEYTDSNISQNLAKAAKDAAQGTADAGQTATDAGQVAADAAKGGAKAAVSGPETPDDFNLEVPQDIDAAKASELYKTDPEFKAEVDRAEEFADSFKGSSSGGATSTSYPDHPGTPEEWARGQNPPPDWVKDSATGKYSPPSGSETNAVTPGSPSDGSYQQAAPLDAAGNPMKQVSFIDLTNGNSGTMNLPDGTTVPVSVFPEGGIQPRLPSGAEKIIADVNGNKVTAYVLNGRAYVPNFKMESVVFKKMPIREMIDRKATVYKWALNESLGRSNHRPIYLNSTGIDLIFENIVRYQRVLKYIIKEAPADAGPGPARPDIPGELRPDMPQAKDTQKPGLLGRAWAGLKNIGHQFTTKITTDKLKMNWQVKGKPTESDELWQFLSGEGVPEEVLKDVWEQSSIPLPQGVGAPEGAAATTEPADDTASTPAAAPAAPAATTATGTIFDDPRKFRAAWEAFADTGKNLPIQVKGVVGDILRTALKTVESNIKKQIRMNKILREAKKIKVEMAQLKKQL